MTHEAKPAITKRRGRGAVFGAITGAVFGLVALLARNSDWVLGAILGVPLYATDVLHEVVGTPDWIFYPLTCVYIALLGSILGVVVAVRRQHTLGATILLIGVLVGSHTVLSWAGARRVFDRVFSDLEQFDWTTIDWREVLGEGGTSPEPGRDEGEN